MTFKIIVIILYNVACVVAGVSMFFIFPVRELDAHHWFANIVLLSMPGVSITVFYISRSDSWLGLYLRGKKAGEHKKTEELEGSAKKDD